MKNTSKTKQDRVKELKNKIHYAESACDTYKETNNFLYQTNSFYMEGLKQKLEELKKS